MADEAEQRATMVHALREEPGSYIRTLENGTEVIYAIRPSDGRFIAEWEYGTGEEPVKSHKEEFSSHADAFYVDHNLQTTSDCASTLCCTAMHERCASSG